MSRLRMERRRKVMTFTPVYDVRRSALLGYLGDLTMKGALLISEKPVEVGRILDLAIEFRETSEAPLSTRMTISARVAWCKLEDHHTYYNVGMEFQNVTEQDKQMVGTILEKYEVPRKTLKKENG